MGYSVKCPLCGADMPLTELESKPNDQENKTYVWVCNDCPGVLLEWWTDRDTDAFSRYVQEGKGIIKQHGLDEETNKNNAHPLKSMEESLDSYQEVVDTLSELREVNDVDTKAD